MKLLSYVNPLQGTDSTRSLSTGNTLPLVAMPYGMAHWCLQTDDAHGWHFHPKTPKLIGIRCTHQPSPWMGDYGAFVITPQSGTRYLSARKRATAWRIDKATIKPHYMRAELASSPLVMEAAPTERGLICRFTFPEGFDARVIIEGIKGETHFDVRPDGRTIVGYTRGSSGGVPENFANYFVAVLDHPITSWATFKGNDLGGQEATTGDAVGLCAELGRASEVTLRVATSFISIEQAELNLQREIDNATLEEISSQAEAVWEKTLGQIEIETSDEKAKATFYSCLYRTKLFPRIWHETDKEGNQVHFSPYDGQVHPGPQYSDTGFWDTYRTLHPLMTLLEPERQSEILQGFINAYHESGWLPQWPSPGHRYCMPGTHLDATIADAVAKGLKGFDLESALTGMLRHADGPVDDGSSGTGRRGIEDYLRHGYCVGHASVSQTLDYAYDDWAIAQSALALGKQDVAERMLKRAENYRKIYDESVGFMRPRNPDGTWDLDPFDPLYWGGAYTEGGPWQSSWGVQHDPAGLIKLMGGDEAFAAKLDEMLTTAPHFHVGGYSEEIHEMTEMAVADFGQYAHSNQPVHHVLYLYLAAGKPWRTQKEVRRVMEEMYSADGFAGDEDNGEMAAWYVLSALGIFSHCPGLPEWALGSPLFTRATVHLPNGKDLVFEAPSNSVDHVYVGSVSHDGETIEGTTISHNALAAGGTVSFEMSSTHETAPTPATGRPASMSPYEG